MGVLAARIAGNSPPKNPRTRENVTPLTKMSGVMAKSKLMWENVCQLMVYAVYPLIGRIRASVV